MGSGSSAHIPTASRQNKSPEVNSKVDCSRSIPASNPKERGICGCCLSHNQSSLRTRACCKHKNHPASRSFNGSGSTIRRSHLHRVAHTYIHTLQRPTLPVLKPQFPYSNAEQIDRNIQKQGQNNGPFHVRHPGNDRHREHQRVGIRNIMCECNKNEIRLKQELFKRETMYLSQ